MGRKVLVSKSKKIDNLFTIVVMGDCRNVIKQLKQYSILSMPITELHFSNYKKGYDCTWLRDSIKK